ncbi:PCI domain-containing protein [Lachancea thermotolerans]|uniref:KLTH0G03916p n=1 Tax=Lachancea thermotolerans (strain ATCC 56472 / CBS 6340 / NRRL Y-8284) TaxID=559295 RepID=C5DLV8_LACTC|nr:KLTH0G03916p [Lachancea thermotolerans CBS 6340]CAR24769.1 KLTH0G03916p [Lachancea thermotolerans CBS 6340]
MSQDIDTILSTLRTEADPELAGLFYEFEDFYEQKLWHQLTERLDVFFHDERSLPLRLRVYDTFVSKFQDKINQLKLTNFLLLSLKDNSESQDALDYLTDLQKSFKEMDEKKQRNDGLKSHYSGILLIDIEIARIYLVQGDLVKARDSLDEIETTLEFQDSLPLQVISAFYSTSAEYYLAKKDFNSFYYTSLLYLSTAETLKSYHELSPVKRQQLAYNLCVAALLGDKIYNLGELLNHPIMESISSDPQYEWLSQFLQTLSNGDFDQFDKLSKERVPHVPILSAHESFLRQKICLMTLVESVFVKNIRTLSFDDIAAATHLPKDNVEHLVMRSISLGLLKGSIDQVNELVTVAWVQPRIINGDQINKMKQRLVEWNEEVSSLGKKIEARGKSIWV